MTEKLNRREAAALAGAAVLVGAAAGPAAADDKAGEKKEKGGEEEALKKGVVGRRVRVLTTSGGSFFGTVKAVEDTLLYLTDVTEKGLLSKPEQEALDGMLVEASTVARVYVFKAGTRRAPGEE